MFGLRKKENNDIDVINAYELINENKSNSDFVILDVRTKAEYDSERIEDAKNIDYKSKDFKIKMDKLDKNIKYLVYCRSGHRSANAVKDMKKLGFEDVLNISGGIMKWNRKGLPMK
jgi:rhodanese-related sulfurtransferase